MSSWAGSFKFFVSLFVLMSATSALAISEDPEFKFESPKWERFAKDVELQHERDRKNGISYVISGSLALLGGIVGERVAEDTSEKGIYAVFQTMGVASIGYGAYTWQIGGEERSLYNTLQISNLPAEQRTQFLQAYLQQRKSRERQDRKIRAVTHGLISALNFYNATQQKQDGLKSALYFVGSVNLLAAISFTFEF